jgi:TctA family transporter
LVNFLSRGKRNKKHKTSKTYFISKMPLFNIICISKTLLYDLYFLDSPRQKVSVKFWQSPRRDYFLPGKSLFIITVKEFRPVFSIYQVSIFFFFFFLFFFYIMAPQRRQCISFLIYIINGITIFHQKNKKSNKLVFLVSSFDGPPTWKNL